VYNIANKALRYGIKIGIGIRNPKRNLPVLYSTAVLIKLLQYGIPYSVQYSANTNTVHHTARSYKNSTVCTGYSTGTRTVEKQANTA
jgi:hypothetical protein